MTVLQNHFYLRPTNGNDSNDGKDFFGFGLSGATFTNATKTLTLTNAFTGYTWTSGDRIAITGGTGVFAALYTIASKTDNSNIVLDDDIGGTNPSDVTSSSGAFATLQKLADQSGNDHVLHMCPEAVELTTVQVDFDVAGASTGPCRFVPGNTTNGEIDFSLQYTIRANDEAMTAVVAIPNAGDYLLVHNLVVDANDMSTYGLRNTATGTYKTAFYNCRMTGAEVYGLVLASDGSFQMSFFGCEIDNNTSNGVGYTGNGSANFWWCKVHDNGGSGIETNDNNNWSTIAYCQIYDNGVDGIRTGSSGNTGRYFNNTIYGNSGDGMDFAYFHDGLDIFNNTCVANGGYGYKFNAADYFANVWMHGHNHAHNNTSGDTDIDFESVSTTLIINGDPKFVSVTDGSEDFSLQSDSPLLTAGVQGLPIGACPPAVSAGGGTRLIGMGGLIG